MLAAWSIATVAVVYVLGLFTIAYLVDRTARRDGTAVGGAVVYSLSLAVYCTSWTFYGSVGRAVASGVGFLPVYLGPTLVALLWWSVLRKTVRIAKENRITSIADFLGARYGHSALIGAAVTVIMVIGITPYIALQLKAISQTFEVLLRYPVAVPELAASGSRPFYTDTAFGTAIVLILFGIMFGARDLDSSRRHEGLVATIAFESLVKLLAFLAVGIFVTYGAFGGFADLFTRIANQPRYAPLLGGDARFSYGDWAAITWLSMAAIVLLPRQFHLGVVAAGPERHITTAMWMFPAYLFLINVFVLPVAYAGLLTFGGVGETVADYFVLTLPMAHEQQGLALFAFIGGFSAATGMVIVESIALSTMILNTLVVPAVVRRGFDHDVSAMLINAKRVAIAVTVLLGYAYYHLIGESYTLVNIGLISFAAVAQFAPAFLGALYWRRATRLGALAGLGSGFAIWSYTLLLPSFVRSGWLPDRIVAAGPFGIEWLRPEQLFGVTALGFWSNTVFWSLLFNVVAFAVVSVATTPSPLEAAQAERFVGALRGTRRLTASSVAEPNLPPERLEDLVAKFMGRDRARAAFADFFATRGIADPRTLAESERRDVRDFAERTLSGAVGSASAQAIMESLGHVATDRFDAIFDVFGKVSRSLEQSQEELQRRVRELSLLYDATRQIAATLDPAEMMDAVVALLRREFDFSAVAIRLRDADGLLHVKSHAGLGPEADVRGMPPSADTSFGRCYRESRVVVIEDAAADRRGRTDGAAAAEPHSSVHAPILVEERPIGVLSAYSPTERVYFSPELLQFFRMLGVQLGLGIRNAELYGELGDLSRDLEAKVRQRTGELEEANRRLTELDRLKSDFVSTVSHELRTPLTSIRSLSETLFAGADIPRRRQEQLLAVITQESERLSRMINDLLDLSRIEAGRMEWRMEQVGVDATVAHAVGACRALFDRKGIALATRSADVLVRVVADRDKIIQVLTNLLSNAAKFTPPGGVVTVRTSVDGGYAVVEVEDTGAGIAPGDIERIFERFHQGGDTLTAKPEGAGLGLPISREIVQHHGGTLTVRSTVGAGTCFRLSLPLAPDGAGTEPA